MAYSDIKTQQDVIDYVQTTQGIVRETVNFYQQLDFAISIRALIRHDINVEASTLSLLVKDFILNSNSNEENLKGLFAAFANSRVDNNLFEDAINGMDNNLKELIGLLDSEIIDCSDDKTDFILKYIKDKKVVSYAMISLSFFYSSDKSLRDIEKYMLKNYEVINGVYRLKV